MAYDKVTDIEERLSAAVYAPAWYIDTACPFCHRYNISTWAVSQLLCLQKAVEIVMRCPVCRGYVPDDNEPAPKPDKAVVRELVPELPRAGRT